MAHTPSHPATPSAHTAPSAYTASQFEVLEGLEGVRRRPAMYIGSTDRRGVQHCVWEILDNAVDEALAGFCSHITVTLHADTSVSVEDDGRGIPTDTEPRTGLPGLRVVFERLHAGGKFGGGAYGVAGGLHGVGAAVVNAVSSRLDVTTTRDGRRTGISFHQGTPGTFDSGGTFSPEPNLVDLGAAKQSEHGTLVRYWLDDSIFSDRTADFEALCGRARQSAFLVGNLTISCVDERGEEPVHEEFSSEGGISQLLDEMASDQPLIEPLAITGEGEFSETVPGHGDSGPQLVDRHVDIQVALRWTLGYDTRISSFVNVVETKGGTHVASFERSLVKAVTSALDGTRILRAGESATKDDVLEGLVAVVIAKLPEPQFEGQTKEALATPEVAPIVANAVTSAMVDFFTSSKTKAEARRVLEKVGHAAKARLAARAQREIVRRKNALESSTLPAKLKDCRSDDVDRTELLIVEGDSALGTALAARDSRFQALLPIRGKILNTMRASEKKMLDNAECAAIIATMGAGSGKSFDLSQARYSRLVTLVDADVDGSHIRTLLVTLVFRYMRPLLEAGRVYASVAPLFGIAVGRKDNVIYTYSDAEQETTLRRLEQSGKKVIEVQRFKGLGEMDADELALTTLLPGHRTLRRISMADAVRADQCFTRLMGDDATARREFIAERGGLVDPSRLDI